MADCIEALSNGVNVAVVFALKKSQPLPEIWNGYRVVSGDTTDLRFTDERGVVVGLYAKGAAKKDCSWSLIEKRGGGASFRRGTLQVIYTVQKYEDRRVWLHVSVCGRKGAGFYLPSFEELKRVKRDFIGEDAWAYQVFPSAKDYVNQHPCVLHLYALMDGAPALPDFTWGLGAI